MNMRQRIGTTLACAWLMLGATTQPSALNAPPLPLPVKAPAVAAVPGVKQTLAGRVLDVQNGFVFFSTGGSYKLAPGAVVTNLDTRLPFSGDDFTGYYAEVGFAADGSIRALSLTRKTLKLDDFGAVERYAVTLSTPYSNPDFHAGAEGFTGEPVLVSFTVAVPPETPITDNVYLSTDASQWDPLEIHMDRIDALHYRVTKQISSGTRVLYRYTRGSWRSAERGRTGLEDPPRSFTVQNLDLERRDDIVYHWSDENASGSQPITPDSIPTPFNNNPFVQPTTRPPGY